MKICIIGSGYVGLVSGACFSDLGNTVICVDINKVIVEKLNKGIIPIYEPGLQELVVRNLKKKRLSFTTDISSSIIKSDIIFICVGTPTKNNKADLKYVFNVIKVIKSNLNRYKIIVTKSTVPVTTGDKITKILKLNKNKNKFDVVSNPEFLREGEASPSLKNSGLDTTSNLFLFLFNFKIFVILSPVVTGTVDLVTIILYLFRLDFITLITLNTYFKSALLFLVGVPTQINMISDFIIELEISVVNESLFFFKFLTTNS